MTPVGARAGAAAASPRIGALLIAAAAVAAMLPELIVGLSISDSMRYNIGWADQFIALVRAGDLYPRWLPRSWDGLGSPTFYFYPPLFFWAALLADLVTLGQLPTGAAASLASLVLLLVSGLAMRAWLAAQAPPRVALVGALAYMLAPYHLYDIYGRGALAEACAYAWLPLVMLAIRRIGERSARGVPLLAASYGALAMSHLPVALLASLFAIPPYVLYVAARAEEGRARFLALTLAGGLLGLSLAAAYLLPAITLTRHISADALFGSFYNPDNWFFWRPSAWPRNGLMLLILPLAAAALLLAIAALRSARGAAHSEARFWSVVTLATLTMISGALPFLWKLPFLAQVQFPWRLFVVTEFAAVTALALARPNLRGFAFAGAIPLVASVAVVGSAILFRMTETSRHAPVRLAEIRAEYRDAPEYLPAGSAIPLTDDRVPETSLVALPAVPLAAAPGARAHAVETADGGMRVEVAAPLSTRLVVRRFYFPHWRVTGAAGQVATAATPGDRLLSWRVPAGRSSYRVAPGAAPGERGARALSFAALAVLIAGSLFLLAKARRQRLFHEQSLQAEA